MHPLGRRTASVAALVAVIIAATAVSACTGGGGSAQPSFDRSAPCTSDVRMPGAYPELEALVPRTVEANGPTTVDSGRSCSPAALGTLVTHGVRELRFAGATWDHGAGNADSVVVLSFDGIGGHEAWVEEFYEAGARAGRSTDLIATDRPTIAGRSVFRLTTLNALSYQSVVVWPDGPVVRVVLSALQLSSTTTKADQDEAVVRLVEAVIAKAPVASPAASG